MHITIKATNTISGEFKSYDQDTYKLIIANGTNETVVDLRELEYFSIIYGSKEFEVKDLNDLIQLGTEFMFMG